MFFLYFFILVLLCFVFFCFVCYFYIKSYKNTNSFIVRNWFYIIKDNKFFFFFIFFLFFCCFYFKICDSSVVSLYYKKDMVELRNRQKLIRPILHKFNKQLFKLKYYVVRNSNNESIWYSLGKLYEVKQNYVYALNSFYNAYMLNKLNNNFQLSYLYIRLFLTRGNIDLLVFEMICEYLQKVPNNVVFLSLIDIDNLLFNFYFLSLNTL